MTSRKARWGSSDQEIPSWVHQIGQYLFKLHLRVPLVHGLKNKLTSWPRRQPNSSATRFATDMAATRRGWVQPILPRTVNPASARYCVICVVLPLPVSPMTTSVWCCITACARNEANQNHRKEKWRTSGLMMLIPLQQRVFSINTIRKATGSVE